MVWSAINNALRRTREIEKMEKLIVALAVIQQVIVLAACAAITWWLFSHGFHDLGEYLIRLKTA